ncbi:hypothetical protein EJB05_57922, partial [Eragrostis curvula]
MVISQNLKNDDSTYWTSLGTLYQDPCLRTLELHSSGICVFSPIISAVTYLNICVLEFDDNLLEGEFPPCFQPSSETIISSNNRFSGKFPPFLQRCTNLYILDLAWNNFSGELPMWIGDLVNQEIVRLNYNNFSGNIPATTTKLTKLLHENIAANSISGVLPLHLSKLTGMKARNSPTTFGLYDPDMNLTVGTKGNERYYEERQMWNMVSIDLSSNSLTGEIPNEEGSHEGVSSIPSTGRFHLCMMATSAFVEILFTRTAQCQIMVPKREMNMILIFGLGLGYIFGPWVGGVLCHIIQEIMEDLLISAFSTKFTTKRSKDIKRDGKPEKHASFGNKADAGAEVTVKRLELVHLRAWQRKADLHAAVSVAAALRDGQRARPLHGGHLHLPWSSPRGAEFHRVDAQLGRPGHGDRALGRVLPYAAHPPARVPEHAVPLLPRELLGHALDGCRGGRHGEAAPLDLHAAEADAVAEVVGRYRWPHAGLAPGHVPEVGRGRGVVVCSSSSSSSAARVQDADPRDGARQRPWKVQTLVVAHRGLALDLLREPERPEHHAIWVTAAAEVPVAESPVVADERLQQLPVVVSHDGAVQQREILVVGGGAAAVDGSPRLDEAHVAVAVGDGVVPMQMPARGNTVTWTARTPPSPGSGGSSGRSLATSRGSSPASSRKSSPLAATVSRTEESPSVNTNSGAASPSAVPPTSFPANGYQWCSAAESDSFNAGSSPSRKPGTSTSTLSNKNRRCTGGKPQNTRSKKVSGSTRGCSAAGAGAGETCHCSRTLTIMVLCVSSAPIAKRIINPIAALKERVFR